MSKLVVTASQNPVKLQVTKKAFAQVFPEEQFEFVSLSSESGVPDQPFNDEVEQGASNRLAFIKAAQPEADYFVSQEGGLYEDGDRLYNRAWIMMADQSGFIAQSSTPLFYIPSKVVKLVRSGMELGHAADVFFDTKNSKQSAGTLSFLTDGLIDRENYYLQTAVIALAQLKHKDWYK